MTVEVFKVTASYSITSALLCWPKQISRTALVHGEGKWSLPLDGRSCQATLKGCGYIGVQILIISLPAQSFLKLNTGSFQYAFSMMS